MAKLPTMDQLEAQKAKSQARADAEKKKQRRLDAQMRAVEREEVQKRRLKWGHILEDLGLFAWEDDVLKEVITSAFALFQHAGELIPRTPEVAARVMAELTRVDGLIPERNGVYPEAEGRHAGSVAAGGSLLQ